MNVQINSSAKAVLRDAILANVGNNVAFSNGCWISLRDDEEVFWGEAPYGTTWSCNSGQSFADAVVRWLAFWDEPRTETGELIVREMGDPDCRLVSES